MPLERFSITDLARLDDGKVVIAFDNEVRHALADLQDRPAVKKGRKIKLEIELAPISDGRGELQSVAVAFNISSSRPKLESRDYEMDHRLVRGGDGRNELALMFNPDTPDSTADSLPFEDQQKSA